MSDTPKRYLVQMTTLRGVFYMCGSVNEGIVGWTQRQADSTVTRYQLLHAAKIAAQSRWHNLTKLFDVLSIEVVTEMGEPVWQAQGQPWELHGEKAVQP